MLDETQEKLLAKEKALEEADKKSADVSTNTVNYEQVLFFRDKTEILFHCVNCLDNLERY